MKRNGLATRYPTLKAWRDSRKWTQQEAADFLNITQGHYSRLENGKAPRSQDAPTLSRKTGVPLEALLGAA